MTAASSTASSSFGTDMKATLKAKIKRFAAIAVAGAMALSAFAFTGCGSNIDPAGKHHVTLEVEGYSPITIELDGDAAPETVENFLNLVNDGYYDGKSFYRVVEDFCLQGGSNGSDGSVQPITGEFSSNGVANPLADEFGRGTVAMARTNDPNSATTEFFVTLGDNQTVGISLDGKYAAFGTINESGMKIIDQIVSDYASYAGGSMGFIQNNSNQATITKMEVVD